MRQHPTTHTARVDFDNGTCGIEITHPPRCPHPEGCQFTQAAIHGISLSDWLHHLDRQVVVEVSRENLIPHRAWTAMESVARNHGITRFDVVALADALAPKYYFDPDTFRFERYRD